MHHFFQRHQDISFDVVAACSCFPSAGLGAPRSKRSSVARTPAEKLLEEIAEPGPIKMKLHIWLAVCLCAESVARRRTGGGSLIPIHPQTIVLLAIGWIP